MVAPAGRDRPRHGRRARRDLDGNGIRQEPGLPRAGAERVVRGCGHAGARGATALYLAPTKALAADQLARIEAMAVPGVRAATYDGDTPPDERRWIRDHANVVLTNPDLLHHSLLPGHERWSRFLRSLQYVVVDECHVYRGVFGSHVSAVLRRLRRVAARYGASPTFVLASATVSDPATHAARLIGMPVTAVTDDGSPRGAMTFALWEPATGRRADGVGRRTTEAAEISRRAGARRRCRPSPSREVAPGSRRCASDPCRHVEHDDPARAERRRGLPRWLPAARSAASSSAPCATGRCVGWPPRTRSSSASTSAVSMRCCWPAGRARRASLWQQAGRAGRSGEESLAVFVAADDPLDTYLVHHPEAIFGEPVEADGRRPRQPARARPAPGRRRSRAAAEREPTCRCSATAAPLLDTLVAQRHPAAAPSGWFWARERPRRPTTSRCAGRARSWRIVEHRTGRVLGTIDEASSHAQVHTGAVHVHQGDTFVVTELDLEAPGGARGARRPGVVDASRSRSARSTSSAATQRSTGGRCRCRSARCGCTLAGDRLPAAAARPVRCIGTHPLDLPERTLTTKAVWWTMPGSCCGRGGRGDGGIAGRGARRRARGHRDAAAGRHLRPVGRRRGVDGAAPRHRRADDHGLRRPPRRGGLRRAGVRAVRGVAAGHPRGGASCRCGTGLPRVRAVAEVRQRQRAARQGRRGDPAASWPWRRPRPDPLWRPRPCAHRPSRTRLRSRTRG